MAVPSVDEYLNTPSAATPTRKPMSVDEYLAQTDEAASYAALRPDLSLPEPPPEESGDFFTGLSHSMQTLGATGAGLAGLVGDVTGVESLRDWGFDKYQAMSAEMAQERKPYHSTEGVESFGDAVDFAQYWLGYGLGQLGEAIVSGGIGAQVAKRLAKEGIEEGVKRYVTSRGTQNAIREAAVRAQKATGAPFKNVLRAETAKAASRVRSELTNAAAKRGWLGGAAVPAYGQSLGGVYGEAGTEALARGGTLEDVDTGRVIAGGLAAGTLEFAGDILTAGAAKFGPAKNLLSGLAKTEGGVASRMAKRGLIASQGEGITELAQTYPEHWGAGKEGAPEPHDLLTSYFAGAIGGGAAGAIGGLGRTSQADLDWAAKTSEQRLAERLAAQERETPFTTGVNVPQAKTPPQAQPQNAPDTPPAPKNRAEASALYAQQLDTLPDDNPLTPWKDILAEATQNKGKSKTQLESGLGSLLSNPEETRARIELAPATTLTNNAALTIPQRVAILQRLHAGYAEAEVPDSFASVLTEIEHLDKPNGKYLTDLAERFDAAHGALKNEINNTGEATSVVPAVAELVPTTAVAEPVPAKRTPVERLNSLVGNLGLSREALAERSPSLAKLLSSETPSARDVRMLELFLDTTSTPDYKTIAEQMNAAQAAGEVPKKRGGKPYTRKDVENFVAAYNLAGIHTKLAQTISPASSEAEASLISDLGATEEDTGAVRVGKSAGHGALESAQDVTLESLNKAWIAAAERIAEAESAGNLSADDVAAMKARINAAIAVPAKTPTKGNLAEAQAQLGAIMAELPPRAKYDAQEVSPFTAEYKSAQSELEERNAEITRQNKGTTVARIRDLVATGRLDPVTYMEEAQAEWTAQARTSKGIPSWENLPAAAKEEFLLALFEINEAFVADTESEAAQAELRGTVLDIVGRIRAGELTKEASNVPVQRNAPEGGESRIAALEAPTANIAEQPGIAESGAVSGISAEGAASDSGEVRPVKVTVKKRRTFTPPAYSRSTERGDVASTARSDVATIERVLRKPLAAIRRRFPVKVVQSTTDVLFAIPADASGVYHNGEVYLIADNIWERDAREALAHEAVGHLGIEALLGPQMFNGILKIVQQQKRLKNPRVLAIIDKLKRKYTDNAGKYVLDERQEAREIIAHIAEGKSELLAGSPLARLYTRIKTTVKRWLTRHGFGNVESAVLDSLIVEAAQFVQGRFHVSEFAAEQEAAYSRTGGTSTMPSVSDAPKVKAFMEEVYSALPPRVQSGLKTAKRAVNKLVLNLTFTQDLVSRYTPLLGSSLSDWYDTVRRRTYERDMLLVDLKKITDPLTQLDTEVQEQLAKYLNKTTRARVWGFQPGWIEEDVVVDPDMKALFAELPTDNNGVDVQQTVKDMFSFGHRTYVTMQEELLAEMRHAHNQAQEAQSSDLVKMQGTLDALPAKDPKRSALQKKIDTLQERMESDRLKMAAQEEAHRERLEAHKTPYMPLRRWGKLVVIGKSEAFLDAEARAAGDDVLDAREARKELQSMKSDAAHYRVSFTDSQYEADTWVKDWEADGLSVSEPAERLDYFSSDQAIPHAMITRITQQFKDDDSAESRALEAAAQRLYIHALDESSVRKTELHRQNVYGENPDMLRAYVENIQGTAHLLAALRTNRETYQHVAEMKKAAKNPTGKGSKSERMQVLNHVLALQNDWMTYKDSAWDRLQGSILGHTSNYMLLTTPSYYLQNSTQVAMLVVPMLAGRFGYDKTISAVTSAYTETARLRDKIHGKALFSGVLFDVSMVEDANTRDVLSTLQGLGLLDIGIEPDLGKFQHAHTKLGGLYQAATNKMRHAVRTVELYNRSVTAISSYNLRLEQLQNEVASGRRTMSAEAMHTDAKQFALKQVQDTQGDYAHINAPRIIEALPAGRMILQFRKFQLIQISLLARTTRQMFKGATKEERAIARAQMGYLLGHHAFVGGALGLPMANLIAPLLAMAFGDEDEPEDFEVMVRRYIKDKDMADLLLQGVPSYLGVDVQNRLSMSTTFSVLPFADLELSRKGYQETVVAALGPAVSLGGQFVDGAGLIASGDTLLGTAQLLPRAVRDTLRAYVYHTDGVRNRRDEKLLTAEDVSLLTLFGQAIGLPPKQLTDRFKVRELKESIEAHFQERAREIRKQYNRAREKNDARTLARMRTEWQALQKVRVAYGLKQEPITKLQAAYRAKLERERETIGGVQTSRGSRGLVEELYQ